MPATKDHLTPKQTLFVKEYIVDFNASRAALAAKYSQKTAYRTGSENLQKPQIQAAIQKEIQNRALRVERTADEVVDLLWKMNEYSLEDYFDISVEGEITAKRFDQLKSGAAKLINGIKFKKQALKKGSGEQEFLSISDIEYKMPNKDKMIELLMRHYGLFEKDNEQGLSEAMLAGILGGLASADPKAAEAVKAALIATAKKK